MKNYLKNVRAQYENFPYPMRAPEGEKISLTGSMSEFLDLMNHNLYGGTQTFCDGFRVLVAGGGTGDSTVFLAEQLQHFGGQVVHLDMSANSMKIAKERARIRGLENITWVHDSLLNLPDLDLGEFDYINCIGVLHHLKHPEEGLNALASVLKDDGVIHIMVYAMYGRTAIYHMQDLLRMIEMNTTDIHEKISDSYRLFEHLPPTNWFVSPTNQLVDHKDPSGSGLVDMCLHAQDRAYTVKDIYEFVENCGLVFSGFSPAGRSYDLAEDAYDPGFYVKDPVLLQKIRGLDQRVQQSIAELINGGIYKHTFHVGKQACRKATIDDRDNIISVFSIHKQDYYGNFRSAAAHSKDLSPFILQLVYDSKQVDLVIKRTLYSPYFFKHWDGYKTTNEMIDCICDDLELSRENEIIRDDIFLYIKEIYTEFRNKYFAVLRHRCVRDYYKEQQIDFFKLMKERF